ncbi:MAG: phenylalanine--tRNA ligase subunit beta [Magnetococcales bacterium]|nr:phenylalanine--tRNA ligase subunit beta [Magnetococcales bacterium]
MKFTHRWLKEHLETPLTPHDVAARLTLAGLEVSRVEDLAQGLDKVQVGFLEAVDPHPDAQRLTVCRVRVGEERLQVVCGATNHRPGDKVAVARVGAHLPGGMEIAQSTIRGQTSAGMLCSLSELGLATSSDGILILPPTAPEGGPVAPLLGRNDHLLEVELTPNRGDCLGVLGIARELAALTDQALRPPAIDFSTDPRINESHPVQVRIEDGVACPRYAGRVITGVRIAPSPPWLRQRLEAVGLRAINNVVDATNYLMLDLGQPLHAFDLATLAPPIVIRGAWDGETLTTLDGVSRTLTPEMTLIADSRRPLALAGIMGGAESGVSETTTTLFLEAACFNPLRIARTGRHLGIQSDSRHRFERGVDPEGLRRALDRLTRLVLDLAGGQAGPGLLVDAGTLRPPPPIPFRHARAMQLAGVDLPRAEVQALLARLGCRKVSSEEGETELYQPPSYRLDLRREEDLVEEIIRVYGYDRVPSRLPVGPVAPPVADPLAAVAACGRRVLVGLGYLEAINFAFVNAGQLAAFTPEVIPLPLLNPISEEQGVMRTLLAPGLLEAARRNLSRGNDRLRLFEVGRVFLPEADGAVAEAERLGGLLCGSATGRAWHTPARAIDFFDLKGDVTALLAGFGLGDITYRPEGPAFLHPGRKAALLRGDVALGWLGQLHPALQVRFDLPLPLFLFEIDLERLVTTAKEASAPTISRYPAVARDFAFVVDVGLPAAALMQAIGQVAPDLTRAVNLFDLYTGEHLPPGRKSLGVEVVFQAADRTLTDAEVQGLVDAIVVAAQRQFAATLRGPA